MEFKWRCCKILTGMFDNRRRRNLSWGCSRLTFTINLVADLQQMLSYEFMQHAFEAGDDNRSGRGHHRYFVVTLSAALPQFRSRLFRNRFCLARRGQYSSTFHQLRPDFWRFILMGGRAIAALGKATTNGILQDQNRFSFTLGLMLCLNLYTAYATEDLFHSIRGDSRISSVRWSCSCRNAADPCRNRLIIASLVFSLPLTKTSPKRREFQCSFWVSFSC